MPKLYVIDRPENLNGKEIAYTELRVTTYEKIVIVTKDGGLYMASFEEDYNSFEDEDDRLTVTSLKDYQIEKELFNHTSLQKRLIYDKVFTQEELNEFMKNQIENRKQENEAYRKWQEENERKEFERLKAKYGGEHHDIN